MRRYYLHRRKGLYYVEFVSQTTGRRFGARSTRTRDRDEALIKVAEWLKTGLPAGRAGTSRPLEVAADVEALLKTIKKTELTPEDAMRIVSALRKRELIDIPIAKYSSGNVDFVKFLRDHWNYDTSPYVREKLAYRHSIGRSHCRDALRYISKYWEPAFSGKKLREVTRDDLKKFTMSLSDKGLAAESINMILGYGTTIIRWACREGEIASDPSKKLHFSGKRRKRGVFTPDEAAAVFSVSWPSDMLYTANLLAITTGMRIGEIRALRPSDIIDGYIHVKHSWNRLEGLKSTKTDEDERPVFIFPDVRTRIEKLIESNPYGKDGFIFYSEIEDKPVKEDSLRQSLKNACLKVNANPPGWTKNPKEALGDGVLWEVTGRKNKNGELVGKWSEPIQVESRAFLAAREVTGNDGEYVKETLYRKCIGKPKAPMYIDCKARNIVFHSHRHYFAARMTDKMTPEQVQHFTGHKSSEVFASYADHLIEQNLEHAATIGSEVFAGVLNAAKAVGE